MQRRLELDVPRRFRNLAVGAGLGLSPWMDPQEMASGATERRTLLSVYGREPRHPPGR